MLDRAELLRRRFSNPETGSSPLGEKVAEIIRQHERYGLSHALLAALNCSHAVTTNYDQLYERAYRDGPGAGNDLDVLPYDVGEPRTPWLVKMHGDIDHPDDIVLARSDFVGYSARSGPLGAVVQSLLMTEHLLVVGASLSDDNFLRLAHEVLAFRSKGGARQLGTVLKFTVSEAERELWKGEFDFVGVATGNASEGENARQLAIFLDVLAMEVVQPYHLLDERYDVLLNSEEKDVARGLRAVGGEVHALAKQTPERWGPIASVLEQFGCKASSAE